MKKLRHSLDKILAALLVLTALIFGIQFRLTVPNCGVADISKIQDIKPNTVTLYYAWEDSTEETDMFSFGTADDKYGVASADIIAVVTPTGNIQQSETSLGQEFVVKDLLLGDDFISVGEKAFVYQLFGLQAKDGKIEFTHTLNFMKPENDYLIFMNYSPLNEVQKTPAYLLTSEYLGYVRIGGEPTKTLDKDYKKYDFTELSDYEFFSASEQTTEVLNALRAEMLEKYL